MYDDIEVLSGMWSYADKMQMVVNAENEIPFFDIEKYIKDKPKEKPKATKRFKLNKSVSENNNTILEMQSDWSNQKKCIFELSNIIKSEYYTDYDKWCRTVWSLANYKPTEIDDENLYDIAQHVSQKCAEKYDDVTFKSLWENATSGLSIGTFYYYCKQSDIEQYYRIKCKYFLIKEL